MKPANHVAVNTGFLYVKMIISIIISLFSTRIVLNSLGEVDYGIYNLVGGVIAMLSFLNSAMAISTQRYLSYYMGASDSNKLKTIFSSSVLLHLGIGVVLCLLLEIGGIFLFNGFLNIPIERIGAAKIIFHLMVISTFFTVNSVPFDAIINSHENMLFDSFTGILEAFIKLGIAMCLLSVQSDNLILYGILMTSLTIMIRFLKSYYCFNRYSECKVHFIQYIDFSMLREMFAFAGWNFYGSFCRVISNQGLSIVLNIFFGVLVNAAYGIANQVNSQISTFSANMMKALNPQIVKSEGRGDRERMMRLAMFGSKLSFFLLSIFAIPLIIEMPFVLNLWLKKVPEFSIVFCRFILIVSLIQQFSNGLMSSVTAVGKIKAYQIIMGSLLILNLPLAILLVKFGLPPYYVLVSTIIIEFIALISRILLTRRIAGLNVKYFVVNIFLASLFSVLLSMFFSTLPLFFMNETFLRLGLIVLISTISLSFFGRYISLSNWEYSIIKEIFISLYKKVHNLTYALRSKK